MTMICGFMGALRVGVDSTGVCAAAGGRGVSCGDPATAGHASFLQSRRAAAFRRRSPHGVRLCATGRIRIGIVSWNKRLPLSSNSAHHAPVHEPQGIAMNRIPVAALPLLLTAALAACTTQPDDGLDLDAIQRVQDTRDPKTIAGSAWTAGLDCTYQNPPAAWIVAVGPVECEGHRQNLAVFTTKQRYFRPRGVSKNEPPYCLVERPATALDISDTQQMIRDYCDCEPVPGAVSGAFVKLPPCK
jgi:hypothetical protein